MKRCAWCGQFVDADTEPVTREVYGVEEPHWQPVTQTLCPPDEEFWTSSRYTRPQSVCLLCFVILTPENRWTGGTRQLCQSCGEMEQPHTVDHGAD